MLKRLRFELRYLKGNTPWDHGEVPSELTKFMQGRPPGRAIEFGCGTGTNAIALGRAGWEVVAIDLSWVAIRRARAKAKGSDLRVKFLQGNAARANRLRLPTDAFDLALDIGCFHVLPGEARMKYVRHLADLLRPGATWLLYSFLQGEGPSKKPWPSESEVEGLFEEGFNLAQVEHGWYGERRSAWFTLERRG